MTETKINSVMRKFADRRITRAEAAEKLEVTVRTFNRWAAKRGVERVKSPYRRDLEERAVRREAKLVVANTVLVGAWTVEKAAETCAVSVKTIERWVEKAKIAQKTGENAQKHTKNAGKSRKSPGKPQK